LQSRVGEAVAAFGFPYFELLSASGNFTMGNVAALAGMNDDSRFIQISAQVQPGNSGGPLLDLSGTVIGMVSSKLNAITIMQESGDVPQNVNFAIRAPIVFNFLSSKGVNARSDTTPMHGELPPADVADIAKTFTIQIVCPGTSSKTSVSAAAPAPQTQNSAQEKKAIDFVVSLQAQWSKSNAEALVGLDDLYEDEVMYFGKLTNKDTVIKEKQAFARKFPTREYLPQDSAYIRCSDQICTISGMVDFRSVDPVAKIVSSGVATFEYRLSMSGPLPKISMENGEVRSRTKTALTARSP
jgi:hypothetical protein